MTGQERQKQIKIATPKWADKKAIKRIYLLSTIKTIETGKRYVVDHIIPLKHSLVCGLHNEFNLQVIPVTKNTIKGNNFIVGSQPTIKNTLFNYNSYLEYLVAENKNIVVKW